MIQIIKGTYGLVENGVVRAMTKHSEPFKLPEAREAELVAAGVAVYVDEPSKNNKNLTEIRECADEKGVNAGTKRSRKKRQEATDEL